MMSLNVPLILLGMKKSGKTFKEVQDLLRVLDEANIRMAKLMDFKTGNMKIEGEKCQ